MGKIPKKNSIDLILKDGVHNIIELPDGTKAKVDLTDLLERSDLIASMYGLGGHRSLTDFVNMIDEEDPVILYGLMSIAAKRIKRMYGGKDSEDQESKENMEQYVPNKHKWKPKSKMHKAMENAGAPEAKTVDKKKHHWFDKSKGTISNRKSMIHFLRTFGCPKDKMAEYEKQLEIMEKEGTLHNENFDWITRETLNDENFDLKDALDKMKKARQRSINIKVSLDTLLAQGRNNG